MASDAWCEGQFFGLTPMATYWWSCLNDEDGNLLAPMRRVNTELDLDPMNETTFPTRVRYTAEGDDRPTACTEPLMETYNGRLLETAKVTAPPGESGWSTAGCSPPSTTRIPTGPSERLAGWSRST